MRDIGDTRERNRGALRGEHYLESQRSMISEWEKLITRIKDRQQETSRSDRLNKRCPS